jgi:hypothetical protein
MNASQRLAGADARSPESQGSVTRLVYLLIDPARAFDGIVHYAPWLSALITAVALRFASLLVFYHPTMTIGKLVAGMVFQIGTVAPRILLGSLVVGFVARVWDLRIRWRALFSIITHVYVAYTFATIAVVSVAGAVLSDSAELDLRNPPFVSVAALVPDAASTLVRRIAAEFDLRAAYAAVLLWLGLRGAAPDESPAAATRVVATVVALRLAIVAAVELVR